MQITLIHFCCKRIVFAIFVPCFDQRRCAVAVVVVVAVAVVAAGAAVAVVPSIKERLSRVCFVQLQFTTSVY